MLDDVDAAGPPPRIGDLDGPVAWWGRGAGRSRRPGSARAAASGLAGLLTGCAALFWTGYGDPGATDAVPVAVLVATALLCTRGRDRRHRVGALGAVALLGLATLIPLPGSADQPVARLGTALALLAVPAGLAALVAAGRRRELDRITWLAVAVGAGGVVLIGLATPLQLVFLAMLLAGAAAGATGGAAVLEVLRPAADRGAAPSARPPADERPSGLRTVPAGPAGDARRAEVVAGLSFEGADASDRVGRFAVLMCLATVLATFGVLLDSTATVIGAMLVAPLMTPLMATSLSLGAGWPRRAGRAGTVVALGIALAVGLSAVLAAALPVEIALTSNPQVLARTAPSLLDLVVALAAGSAGAYALSRPDVADALPGVAIAISLVPPLCVVGISLQAGALLLAGGALLLFLTNAVAILVAGIAVFRLTGVLPRTPAGGRLGRVTAASLVAVVSVTVGGLAVSGQRVLDAQGDLRTARAAVDAWLDRADGVDVDAVAVAGGVVDVALTGPVEVPLDVDDLAAELARDLGRAIELEVTVTPRRTVRAAGSP